MMTLTLTRRAVLLGVAATLATPSILRAQGQVRLTLGHGTAPGNPRSVAAERMAALLRERSNGRIEMRVAGSAQLGDDARHADGAAHRHARHVREQPGRRSRRGAGAGRSRPALPVPERQAAYRVIDGPVGAGARRSSSKGSG